MEKFKKTWIMGLAVMLLAGCTSDELPYQTLNEDSTNSESSTTNTVVRRANKDASIIRGTFANGGAEGWAEGDSVCTYTLQSMMHNTYLLSQGAGSANGTFLRTGGTDNYENATTLYALTSTKYLYGLAATRDKDAQITTTIPNRFTLSEVGAAEGYSRMPVPYWGIATFGEDGKLEATFQGLTALLKIDLATLPADTRAVVLTTHSYTEFGDESELDGGDEEPLSGTFDAELKEGAKLASNPIFYTIDTLRVNLNTDDREQYRHIYVPVVAASYTNLHVIAVTRDYRYAYTWDGQLLKTFKSNTPFQPNTIVALKPESTAIITPRM